MTTIRGFKTAAAKARKMARERDTWMTPTDDEPREADSRTDFGAWLQEEQEGWEETTHFQVLYGQRLSDLAHHVADLNRLEGEEWIGIWQDLKDEFWDEWADKHNAADHWEQHIKSKPRRRRKA